MARAKILGLVPAKGGSVRLAQKNVLKVGGRSLLERAVSSLLGSGLCDQVVVSTEDETIASLAREAGATTPFLRPQNLARDPATVNDVAIHCLEQLEASGKTFDILIISLPTCPFRDATDIQEAYRSFRNSSAQFLMSVTPREHQPYNALVQDHGFLSPAFPEYLKQQTSEWPPSYRPNGAIHILDIPAFKQTRTYYSYPLLAHIMPAEKSVDIDTQLDLRYAEFVLQNYPHIQ